ncbi:MAG: hypothetical protein ACK5KR_02310 [Breznakia sp.]
MKITISIYDKNNRLYYENTRENEVTISFRGKYNPFDKVILSCDTYPNYVRITLDSCLAESILYITKPMEFIVPFDNERKPYGENAFCGERHWGYAKYLKDEEYGNYVNLALNSMDVNNNTGIYPHASSNVNTDNPQFYARNIIDGIFETCNHGSWPHSSWGISRQKNAWIMIDFGCEVESNHIVIYLRADFPHDNYFKEMMICFSNGEEIKLKLRKNGLGQSIRFPKKRISWVCFKKMQQEALPSEYPAISQIEVWGNKL